MPSSFPVAPVSAARYVDVFRAKQEYLRSGAAAVQSVCQYLEVGPAAQADYVEQLGTTPAGGTSPASVALAGAKPISPIR